MMRRSFWLASLAAAAGFAAPAQDTHVARGNEVFQYW